MAVLREGKKKRALRRWLDTLERLYADRLLPIDLETSRLWGELTAAAGLIAATARRHGLHVMTRNTGDFESAGALVLNPWAETAWTPARPSWRWLAASN
jgi:predicted nucleic acid-binding protein